ncbi:nuclear transport factor 2 family protein [Mycobacterium sp. 1165178.9]|uniref:nuclear transport factor 2 family protein n=1 Tax=Mycobacterium sp. 1165178.9 TaxID=1834070 RepID=UPI000800B838|nr:nuclear transport factor 2 family protein [Mycobacterium sp. 1165178.9]OBK65562.1 hypothetical protein A5652_00215 [Mycobacterium sp. 1165178.9]
MTNPQSIFARIDEGDADAFAKLFARDATMTFGNGEPMRGRNAIARGSAAFLTSIAGLRHRIVNQWVVGEDTIAEAEVTYTRHDAREVTVPTVSIWRSAGDGSITNYRVFLDLTPVFTS